MVTLEKVSLYNYKEVYENGKEGDGEEKRVKVGLEWREVGGERRVKRYEMGRDGLEMFIMGMKEELKKVKHMNVQCVIN